MDVTLVAPPQQADLLGSAVTATVMAVAGLFIALLHLKRTYALGASLMRAFASTVVSAALMAVVVGAVLASVVSATMGAR